MSGIQYKQGDIIMVPVPFTDLSEYKQRPALIISNNEHNSKVEDLVICGITSNIREEDYSINIDQKDMLEGSLPFISRIKVDKLFTINKKIILRKLGRIKKDVLEAAKKELLKLIN